LRDHHEELQQRNVKIVVVTFENDFFARNYVEDTSLPWPILVDETRETYERYGMLTASFWDIWGPATWWAYTKELLKGEKLQKSEGDVFQRGGDVLIDQTGIVRLHHVGAGPSDRPSVEMILRRVAP
jgi:hypothetical protein